MKKHLFLKITVLFTLFSCNNPSNDNRPSITVSIEPIRYFTEIIAGDKFKVVSMVPEGNSPETYDPTPQQMAELGKSKIYLKIGHIGFEQTWGSKLEENAPKTTFYDISSGIDFIHHKKTHDELIKEGTHSHGADPHTWNSAVNALVIANNIFRALSEKDEKNTEYYRHRLDSLTGIINSVHDSIQAIIPNAERAFLIYHPALTYFARDYGLEQICIEEEGKEPSPARLHSLIQLCKSKNAGIILIQKEFDIRNAETIAKEINGKIVPVNPLNYNWSEEMINTAKALCSRKGYQ